MGGGGVRALGGLRAVRCGGEPPAFVCGPWPHPGSCARAVNQVQVAEQDGCIRSFLPGGLSRMGDGDEGAVGWFGAPVIALGGRGGAGDEAAKSEVGGEGYDAAIAEVVGSDHWGRSFSGRK